MFVKHSIANLIASLLHSRVYPKNRKRISQKEKLILLLIFFHNLNQIVHKGMVYYAVLTSAFTVFVNKNINIW